MDNVWIKNWFSQIVKNGVGKTSSLENRGGFALVYIQFFYWKKEFELYSIKVFTRFKSANETCLYFLIKYFVFNVI